MPNRNKKELREVVPIRLTPTAQSVLDIERGEESQGKYIESLILASAKSERSKQVISKSLRMDLRLAACLSALGVERPFNYPTHRLASAI